MLVASALLGEAFLSAPPPLLKFKTAAAVATRGTRRPGILARENDDADVSVFDAGDVAVSWEDYKKTPKPDEYKVCQWGFVCGLEIGSSTMMSEQ